jgi:DNA polymerase-3 subunit delta'
MAKRSAAPEPNDSDRIEGFAHPREAFALEGQGQALARAARALRAGRPPSAWLITGAPGTGKATLAYRIARYLLAHGATDAGTANLSLPEDDPAFRQVVAQSHPGLLVLKRSVNSKTGKLMTVLSVDEIRRLADFFGMTSGAGGWRVAIVDTADDMNDNAANALLKMLEEPPVNAMLLLLSNTPGRLLPTIRSRCQRLELRPLSDDVLDSLLARHLPEMSQAERGALARLSDGSIGAALTLASGDGADLARAADELIDRADDPDVLALLSLGEKLSRMQDGLERFGQFLTESLAHRIRARAHGGAGGLERWVQLLNRIEHGFGRAAGLHLEPRQTLLSMSREVARTARGGRSDAGR